MGAPLGGGAPGGYRLLGVDAGVDGDARTGDGAGVFDQEVVVGVVDIGDEGAGELIAAGADDDLFADANDVGEVDAVAVGKGVVVELVGARSDLFPDALTDGTGGGCALRVLKLGEVGVPGGVAGVAIAGRLVD